MIIAVSMAHNEADVIGTVVRHLFAQGVDRVVIADNMSTDDTRPILEHLADQHPITILDDNEYEYDQGRKMTALARAAYEMGAEWVLPFDADEVWSGTVGTIAESLAVTRGDIVMAPGWDHIVTEPADAPFSPWRRKHPQKLCKVAFRASPTAELNEGNHDVRGCGDARIRGPLTYRHFQYRSLEQMTAKLRHGGAAINASSVNAMHGTHWREGAELSNDELAAKWAALCAEPDLVHDPVTL